MFGFWEILLIMLLLVYFGGRSLYRNRQEKEARKTRELPYEDIGDQ